MLCAVPKDFLAGPKQKVPPEGSDFQGKKTTAPQAPTTSSLRNRKVLATARTPAPSESRPTTNGFLSGNIR